MLPVVFHLDCKLLTSIIKLSRQVQDPLGVCVFMTADKTFHNVVHDSKRSCYVTLSCSFSPVCSSSSSSSPAVLNQSPVKLLLAAASALTSSSHTHICLLSIFRQRLSPRLTCTQRNFYYFRSSGVVTLQIQFEANNGAD